MREHFVEEAERLGFEPLGNVGSLCAVPLILYDRPVGVMAVHSPKERAFDEGHVEFLRVLASEAGIAIENARLFAEEQKKSRQLTLINNVSSHAITTLDPDEMLAKIAAEMEKSLPYDHIGIAILDYSAKELVVQAEAGARRKRSGRRILLGEGLVGQVARSGQMAIVREVERLGAETGSARFGLLGRAARQLRRAVPRRALRGILRALRISRAGVLLLRTLADLFAGALHNALTFQKAQEQAITDGLTGVKTHRFLMEALSAEWKRSTRANRPFALVLMDLDRFKFVNDFYGHLEGDVVLAARGPHSRAELPPLRRGGALRRRRIRDPHAGNIGRAGSPARQQAARLGRLRSAVARQEHHRQLRHRRVSRCTAPRRRNSSRWPILRCTSPSTRAGIPFRAPSRAIRTTGRDGRKMCSKRIWASR